MSLLSASYNLDVYGYKVPVWSVAASCAGVATIYAGYRWMTAEFDTFKRLGVPGPPPAIIFGATYHLMKYGICDTQLQWREQYGDVVGYHFGRRPIMCFYDTEILKLVMIKEFSSFTNRNAFKLGDRVMDKMLTVLQDDHWKRVRSLLTPTFSSGRLRRMTSQLNRAGRTMAENMRGTSTGGVVIEVKERAGAFSMDAIASTAFGIDIDSKNEPNNAFVRHANGVFKMNKRVLRVMLFLFFPKLIPFLQKIGLGVFPTDSLNFFVGAVDQALEARRTATSDQQANDFIQLMLEAHINNPEMGEEQEQGSVSQKGLTHEEVLSQGLIFFLAGYETTANALAYFLYNVALHPDIQERVHDEIVTQLGDEDPSYENVVQAKYLEQCLEETMRIYPAAPILDRTCSRDIMVGGHFIPAGMTVHIPVQALHHDPQVYHNPKEFRPERFTPEMKASRSPFSFMPFGAGPRMCIGMRLAMLELKMAAIHLVRHFRFSRCEETEVPLQMDRLRNRPKNGIRVFVEARE